MKVSQICRPFQYSIGLYYNFLNAEILQKQMFFGTAKSIPEKQHLKGTDIDGKS